MFTDSFEEWWKDFVENASNSAWLMQNERVLKPSFWRCWRAGRELMWEDEVAYLQRA